MSGEELRALAEAATPGPWTYDGNPSHVVFCAPDSPEHGRSVAGCWNCAEKDIPNAAFIAAANPTAILALLDERDALRAQVERVRALADELHEERQAYTLHTSTALVARDILRSTTRRIRAALDGPQ